MSELKITGNPAPVVGKEESYSVNQLLPTSIPTEILNGSKPNPFEFPVEWSVHVLENGKWIKKEENNKTGNIVFYKFSQLSLTRKGIRILAQRGEQTARLDVKPHNAESPKIDSIEFLDKNGNKPTKPFAYGQTLKARVHCLHMERHTVYATLWEDDAAGAGHNKANEKNKMKTLPGIVKNGIADIDFVLEPDFAKIANAVKAKGDTSEGKTHEYYVTAEILNKKTASKNTNVANPSYKDTTAKPRTPKKETPAQKKGPSKKQEKEKSIGDEITDWWEGLFKVKPIVAPNPKPPTRNNPLKVGEPDKNPKEDEKEGTSCGEKFCIKKGDKSELIREINIRLAGFGGNVPTDEFTDRTEKMIKQFQRDYMKVPETGKVCGNVLKAIDEFSTKFDISTTLWNQIKCSCSTKGQQVTSKLRVINELNNCKDWGDGTGKGTYKTGSEEKNHKYEYPGIHRSLLFGFKAMLFYISKQNTYKFRMFSSGYRCRFKNYMTTNHQGKALDIQFSKDSWNIAGAERRNLVELRKIRDDIFHKYLNAKTSWINGSNNFCLEPIDLIYKANGEIDKNYTYSWIHFDVREFESKYLDDKYFCKNSVSLNGKKIIQLAKDLGFANTCKCINPFESELSQSNASSDRVDPKTLRTSKKGIAFIKDWEGKHMSGLKHIPYNDSKHFCTIGYGHLIAKNKCQNITVPEEFKNGITEDEALKYFNDRLIGFEKAIQRDIKSKLYQYEFDALVSLVFNTGGEFLNTGGANDGETQIKKKINTEEYSAGADEMSDVTNGGTPGLVKRRKAEINMFKNNIYDSTH
ncbi:Endolysin/autolysin [Flavobacteriaceae bacterium]